MRTRRGGLGGVVVVALAGLAGCSTEGSAPVTDERDPVDRQVDALGEEMQDCSRASVAGSTPAYNATSKTLTVNFPSTARSFVLQAPNGQLTVNGYACRTTAGLWLTTSNVQALVVKGSSGDDVFVIDELPGSLKSFGTKGGIAIDGNGGTDSLSLRGTAGADAYNVASTSATTHYADLNNDKNAEIKFTHAGNASLAVSTGKANDSFSAAITSKDLTKFGGNGLAGTVQSLQIPIDAYGGDGDDTITGGAKDDRLFGDNGNDTFRSAVVDGADQYDGGPGTDHLDFTGRTAGVTVDLGLSTPYALGTRDVSVLGFPWSGVLTITPYIRTAAQTAATVTVTGAADTADLAVKITAAAGSPVDAHVRHDGKLVLALKSAGVVDGFTVGGTDAGTLGFADGTTVASRIKVPGGTSYNAPNDGDPTANSGAGEGDDVQDTVETLTGGGGNDTLVGNNLKNTISGGKGDDVLASIGNNYASPSAANGDAFNGGDGDDRFETGYTRNLFAVYTGDGDFDTVTYRKRINVVTVNLSQMTASPGDGESGESGIIADSVEKVVGGSNNDALTGSVRAETLVGGPGSDLILAGAGDDTLLPGDEDSGYGGDNATDTLDGQGGNDKVFYANYTSPLNVRLCFTVTSATAASCAAENGTISETNWDRVGNCEIADLGQGSDLVLSPTLLTGAGVPDLTYYGNDGDDFMTGGDGDDLIYGGLGNNVLDGAGNTGDACVTHKGASDVRRRCELGDKSTAPVCVPGALQCAASGADRVQTCESDGNWSYGVACGGGTPVCSGGVCVAAPTPPGGSGGTSGLVGPGLNDCGPSGTEDCATSLLVPGNAPGAGLAGTTFYRSYDGVDFLGMSYPAQVSDFKLDKFEVTVGRFRKFVDAWVGGWRPAAGAGKHSHLNGGLGLANTAGGFEGGWDASWAAKLGTTDADWNGGLRCDGSMATWTTSPSADEKRPINCVKWFDAVAYCIWEGGFVPSETEWNYAASGGSQQRYFPWSSPPLSSSIDPSFASYWVVGGQQCVGDGLPGCALSDLVYVGLKLNGLARWGHADLAGNLGEWSLDWLAAYGNSCSDCAVLTSANTRRAHRGGSWGSAYVDLRSSQQEGNSPDQRRTDLGIRCARSP